MFDFITANWEGIVAVVAAVVAAVNSVVILTPTTKDDEIVAKVVQILTGLGIVKEEPKTEG